ncbi:Ankyrin repeat and Ankyrin repeat-containing domain-containing protein [Strongyloides ratti]|uniref:Ankyrin repeat and Ankyrin repeat-containing domain-containing protein n=1 Tax=Strongyloides ratti TaxID=34506 RepID=A0A090MZU2_STRRB|nr:Ankyrin repeat and Ankyrin repeat-containing domain-containing protein [Strongyloides ratti]CEF69529.1 Ankyrin repeat and Ankyrin repeat-containing domain-containing protein [Strongyloides ratti]
MDSLQMIFLEAVSIGDTVKIKELLKSGMIDVNYKHKINGWNALHWAARRNFYNICCDLISYGFDPKIKTKQGKSAYEVLPKNASEELKALLFIEEIEKNKEEMVVKEPECNFTPNYIKYPPFPHINNSKNEIINESINSLPNVSESPSISNVEKTFSYGRRGSDVRTRFILVRTCCLNGKEAFKRVTLPGGATVKSLKLTIEKAMKLGSVLDVITLPDNIIIESDDQIKDFNDCQKVEVVFDTNPKSDLDKINNLSNEDSTLKNNFKLYTNRKDIKIKNKGKYSYTEEINKEDNIKKMSETEDNIRNDEESFGIDRLKDDTQLNHEEEFVSDISLQDIGEIEEKKMSYVTIDNGFIQEPPSTDSPTFDIVTSDAVFEDNNHNTSTIKKVSIKQRNTNTISGSNDLDHGLRHVASIPHHQFKAEHVEDHVSPKISLEKKEKEDIELQQFLIVVTTAAAVAIGVILSMVF